MTLVFSGGHLENFTPKEILAEFDSFLIDRQLQFYGVLVGGAAVTLGLEVIVIA